MCEWNKVWVKRKEQGMCEWNKVWVTEGSTIKGSNLTNVGKRGLRYEVSFG